MTTKRENQLFEQARALALSSDMPRAKLGAIVYYKGRVIGAGANSSTPHPLQAKYDRFRTLDTSGDLSHLHAIHAEIAAINSVNRKVAMNIEWEKAEIFIYRVRYINGQEEMGLSKPCPACMAIIRDMKIKTIHYTDNENNFITQRSGASN